MKPSKNCVQLIKNREQCRLTSYLLPNEPFYTIGWGHLCDKSNASNAQWNRAGAKISQATADALLVNDIALKARIIDVSIKIPISQNLYDALVSTAYQYNPSGKAMIALFRFVNLGYPLDTIVSYLTSLGSGYNKKARKADAILATTGKVVHIDRV